MPYSVPAYKDEKIFRRSASHTKSINLGFRIMRGGIRL